jgi:hypothetical protein
MPPIFNNARNSFSLLTVRNKGGAAFAYHSERLNTSTFAKATAGQAGHPHPVLVPFAKA